MISPTRTLLLIRHAQTLHIQHGKSDKERELTHEGKIEAHLAGSFIKTLNLNTILFYTSTAKRAQATSGIIASHLNYHQDNIFIDEDIYSGNYHDLISLIRQVDDNVSTIILVGHYPTIVETHNYISSDQKKSMDTCEITGIEINRSWNEITSHIGNNSIQFRPSQFVTHATL